MKLPLIVSVLVASASCHQLRKAKGPAGAAAAAIQGSGEDYYTKKVQSENAGDWTRGDGSCMGWRRTLECNPSGARDPHSDKACGVIVDAAESGYCECGGYAQFAAVGCSHRPFTCETMCLKFAVVTGKAPPHPDGTLLGPKMKSEQDLKVMEILKMQASTEFDAAVASSNAAAKKAKDSIELYHTVLNKAQMDDAVAGQNYLYGPGGYYDMLNGGGGGGGPGKAYKGLGKVSDEYKRIGKRLQAIAHEILPLNPK